MGEDAPPPEENEDLPDFTPERAHLLLREIYGYLPHPSDGSHLDRGVTDNATRQRCWRRLAATPSGAVGHCFTAILVAEWREILDRSWNSERPFFFANVVLTKTLGVRREKEIWARITSQMGL